MQGPQHTHDCSGCTFIGRNGEEDVYFCDHVDLIRRYGSAEEENHSLPISIVRRHADVRAGWTQALALYDAFLLGAAHMRGTFANAR